VIAVATTVCGISNVLTKPPAQHPWAKYYSERGLARPAVADFVLPSVTGRASRRKAGRAVAKRSEMSADLAAAVAAVTMQSLAPGMSGTPFITAEQRQAVARELRRQTRVRVVKRVLAAFIGLVALHLTFTQIIFQKPSPEALAAHVQALPEAVVSYYSSLRQPLQADGVSIVQADKIGIGQMRYVASVTLRLRQPLYVPAVTNGTLQYRRVQESLQRALDQELRYNLFQSSDAPEFPSLPMLLQRSHKPGETIVVRVPFIARRYGWKWRLAAPQVPLRIADRALQGDSLAVYAETPHLLFGEPKTLADIRRRIKIANDYVVLVAKEVQKRADVVAVVDKPQFDPMLADQPAHELDPTLADQPALSLEDTPAQVVATLETPSDFDPNAPAVFLPPPSKLALRSAPSVNR
jgi:hypothetical protein